MKRLVGHLLAAVFIILIFPVSFVAAIPVIREVNLDGNSVSQLSKLELNVDLSASYTNPFDPDEVDLWADFKAPDGESVRVNGFYCQDYARPSPDCSDDLLTPTGAAQWKVRFAAPVAGDWSAVVSVTDRAGTVRSRPIYFHVVPSPNPGFIHVSRHNRQVLAFSDETPAFLIGRNMASGRGGCEIYEQQFAQLHANGGNWARVWMAPWMAGLEWTPRTDEEAKRSSSERTLPGYQRLGSYNMLAAWQLDRVLDAAQRNGIYVMLTLDQARNLDETVAWKFNPYNMANGGPCATPKDFWSSAVARKLVKQRLRYICARYGWRTNIQSWELWNEALPPKDWVEDMTSYIEGASGNVPADPYHHIVTTSYCDTDVSELPGIDMTQDHDYPGSDVHDCSALFAATARANQAYGKPFLIGEFGIDAGVGDEAYDDYNQAINMHNGLWSTTTSGCAGTAMMWFWRDWMYPQLRAISRFVDGVPWTTGTWHSIEATPLATDASVEPRTAEMIVPRPHWGKAALDDYNVEPGLAGDSMALPQFLLGPAKPAMHTEPLLHVDYPKAGTFTLRVDAVSDCCLLRIIVDGHVANRTTFDPRPGAVSSAGPHYASNKRYSATLYQAEFDADVTVPVPSGRHTIGLALDTGDWLKVASYTLSGYRPANLADATIQGVTNGDVALVWVRSTAYDWFHPYRRLPLPQVPAVTATLKGLLPGRYSVCRYDTQTGIVAQRMELESHGTEGLRISLPSFDTDIGLRIERIEEGRLKQ
ncbi:MAG: DUF5060 domain-containing protein [Capsulimonadaceae bacterium]|nr:DUF5060 domain-containing protein [Capsulimonadaceae bacterium]